MAALLGSGGLGLLLAPPAAAASYRYWTYWWGATNASSWVFAGTGPGSHVPADGAVEGWRFQTTGSAAGGRSPAEGRSPASVFAELCGAGTTPAGSKRVAVLIDYGTAADAPPGQSPPSPQLRGRCLTAAPGTTGAALLARADATLRFDSGLLCGIDGYPRGECAPVVTTAPAATTPTTPRPRPSTTATARPTATTPPAATTTAPAPSGAPSSARPTRTTPASSAAAASPGATSAAASPATSSPPATAGAAPAGSTTPIATAAPLPVDGGQGAPWGALLGLLVVLGVGGAATLRMRGGS